MLIYSMNKVKSTQIKGGNFKHTLIYKSARLENLKVDILKKIYLGSFEQVARHAALRSAQDTDLKELFVHRLIRSLIFQHFAWTVDVHAVFIKFRKLTVLCQSQWLKI